MQEVNSHSFLVRLYYQKRIFMGFCCVSCEVLYLMVSALLHVQSFTLPDCLDLKFAPVLLVPSVVITWLTP